MDDRHRPIRPVDTPQQGEGDGVVTAEGDDARKCLASLGKTLLVGIGEGLAHQDAVVAFLDLLDGPGVVVSVVRQLSFTVSPYLHNGQWERKLKKNIRSNRNISTVNDPQLIVERVRLERHIVAAAEPQLP